MAVKKAKQKVRMTIRLYKRHDLDLLYLYYNKNEDFDFKEEFKNSLKEYLKGKPVKRTVPIGDCKAVSSLPATVQIHINIDPKNDKEIFDWKSEITKGRRNSIMKNVFRNTFPVIEIPFRKESEDNYIKGE